MKKTSLVSPLLLGLLALAPAAAPQHIPIGLSDTAPFGSRTLTLRPNLRGRRWLRFEVWDVATNGAFTQLVWLAGPTSAP
jgi:hypothetical protein